MWKFILCSFAFLGWGFYELSGGSDFAPPVKEVRIATVLATYDVPITRARTTLAATAPSIVSSQNSVESAVQTAPVEIVEETPAEPATTQAAYTPTVVEIAVLEEAELVPSHKVSANRVNMRSGPSTDHRILAKLKRDDEVDVLEEIDVGWSRLRVAASGQVGWIASRLLITNQ